MAYAADSLSSSMVQGMRHVSLVKISMTMMIKLKPHARGKWETKSRVYEWNYVGGTSNGCNALWVCLVLYSVSAHLPHYLQNCATMERIFG